MIHTEPGKEKTGFLPPETFNGRSLLETFMGNRENARSTLTCFIERTEEQLRSLPELEDRQDWGTAQREAHTIKGSALTLSGEELGRIAARLELAYQDPGRTETAFYLSQLETAFAKFKKSAGEWLGKEEQ